jgi:hypothetical protein
MRRNESELLIDETHPVGPMIDRNPGVALAWTTRSFRLHRLGEGVLFRVGPPETIEWFCEGREATRSEVLTSLESGLPLLRAEAERDGPAALRELDRLFSQAILLLPQAL